MEILKKSVLKLDEFRKIDKIFGLFLDVFCK